MLWSWKASKCLGCVGSKLAHLPKTEVGVRSVYMTARSDQKPRIGGRPQMLGGVGCIGAGIGGEGRVHNPALVGGFTFRWVPRIGFLAKVWGETLRTRWRAGRGHPPIGMAVPPTRLFPPVPPSVTMSWRRRWLTWSPPVPLAPWCWTSTKVVSSLHSFPG